MVDCSAAYFPTESQRRRDEPSIRQRHLHIRNIPDNLDGLCRSKQIEYLPARMLVWTIRQTECTYRCDLLSKIIQLVPASAQTFLLFH